MNPAMPSREQLTPASTSELGDSLPRSGREVAGLAEALYQRLFALALGGLQVTCGLTVLAALVRTHGANFIRTATLAVGLALLAAIVLQASAHCYWAVRRRPGLSLMAPLLAFGALAVDGVSHSPLSFAAAASIALPAFICGRRWALGAATLISVGAVSAASLQIGWSALDSVGQGTVAYFVWAIVLAGLAESFAQLTIRMPPIAVAPAKAPPPIRVANLAGTPPPRRPEAPSPSATVQPESVTGVVRLSARQLQVVALLADGLQASDIAQRLGIAPSTVYRCVKQAKERAGVYSRSELVAIAVREGLVRTGAA